MTTTERKKVVSTDGFKSHDEIFEKILERIEEYHPNTDTAMIKKAYEFADKAHDGQKKKIG